MFHDTDPVQDFTLRVGFLPCYKYYTRVEGTNNDRHCSLLQYRLIYKCKQLYDTDPTTGVL
jgi:hypothetical protein